MGPWNLLISGQPTPNRNFSVKKLLKVLLSSEKCQRKNKVKDKMNNNLCPPVTLDVEEQLLLGHHFIWPLNCYKKISVALKLISGHWVASSMNSLTLNPHSMMKMRAWSGRKSLAMIMKQSKWKKINQVSSNIIKALFRLFLLKRDLRDWVMVKTVINK